MPAGPAAVPVARRRVREWLEALAWPEPDLDDVVMAVNEACTNAVEHAYPPDNIGYIELGGRLSEVADGSRHVIILVRDWGRWRPAPATKGFRSHGLIVMRGCMRTVIIKHDDEGTLITMTSFPVPR
jgi:anti-sigma regulatory factor (Ser/Thr protein kinase)